MTKILVIGASGLGSSEVDAWRIPIEEAIAKVGDRAPHVQTATFIWNDWKDAIKLIDQHPDAEVLMLGHSNGVFFMLKIAQKMPWRKFRFIGALDKHWDVPLPLPPLFIPVVSPPAGANIEEILEHHARFDWIDTDAEFTGDHVKKDFDTSHLGILKLDKAMDPMIERMAAIANDLVREKKPLAELLAELEDPDVDLAELRPYFVEVADPSAPIGKARWHSPRRIASTPSWMDVAPDAQAVDSVIGNPSVPSRSASLSAMEVNCDASKAPRALPFRATLKRR